MILFLVALIFSMRLMYLRCSKLETTIHEDRDLKVENEILHDSDRENDFGFGKIVGIVFRYKL